MTPMKDYIKVEVTGDADAVTSELYVENTIENPAWYTVEDNHVSLVSENIEKVIKVETDMLDDCMWESRIEISKDVANQNNAELSLESQNVAVNNIDLNPEKTTNKMFYCNICGKSFALNYLLKNHLAEHKRRINIKNNKCKYCGRQFKLKFGLNRHIQKFHNEHMKSHENNRIPNIKLRKLNGVWKSKTNVFKCNICFLKCHSEKNLVEHMETHDNCLTECNDCFKCVSVSELDNHMEQLHNKQLYKCQKCNLQFVKQQHLNCHLIHCLKSLPTKSNKVCGPFKDGSTTCSACGIIFNNSLSLKNHITMGCKHYTCKYCGQYFSSRILWLRHVDVHEKDEQRVMFRVNKISTIRKYNQTEAVNDSSSNTSEGQLLSRNVTRRNNSEQNDLMNSNSTTVSTASNNSMANDYVIQNIKQEKYLNANAKERNTSHQVINNQSTVSVVPQNSITNNYLFLNIKQEKITSTDAVETNSSDQINLANSNESTISTFSHNSIVNDCHVLNIKQEKNTSTNVIETNSSDQINLANNNESIISTVSQNLIVNDCLVLNIKQEKNTSLNVKGRENSDQMDLVNDNESTVENRLHDLMVHDDPININVANNSVSTIRETPYICIRKLPYIKNVFCNDVNDQTSQNNVIFICRICKKSPSTDIHSFALHMSEHVECNMHECIVCDKTFSTVLLWTNHMTNHQQQLDLNISAVQCNLTEIESNTSGPIDSGNVEPQVCSTSRNRKFKMSLLDDSYSDITSMNNSVNKVKYQYDCSTCNIIFPSKVKLKAHQTLHAKPQSFSCRYCDRIFSGKGQCTNHEKSHIGLDQACFQNNENYTPEATLIQNNISIENNNINTETTSIKHKNKNKLSSTIKTNHCHLCNKKFSKRCYFTNHMQIKHNINPNLPKQLISNSDNENKLPVPVDSDLNNHLNKSNEKKSKFCTICNKYFAHMGALTNHMNIHLDRKPYKCQYCSKQFSKEASYILHQKKHVPKNEVNEEPQIENSNDFELGYNPADGNSNDTNLINMKDLWFTCDVCEKKFSTPFQLNLHRKLHSNVPYVCKICNRSYSLKFRWNWHLKGHYLRHIKSLKSKRNTNDIKSKIASIQHYQDRIKCRYCKKEYNSISQWKKHMTMNKECRRHCKNNLPEFASNHASKNRTKSCRFKCNICKKTYSTSYNRSIHIKNVHNELDSTVLNNHNNTNFQKDKPMEIIQQKPVIKKRNRSNHINGSGTKCKLCGKVYSSVANLGRHVSIVHTKCYEPMTCNVCGRTFKHKFSFREHLKIKHKKLFKNYEEINVKNKRANRKIIPINKKRIMKYFCKICKMKFADNITLQEHSKIHIVDMYNCKDCGQQFETNVTLGNHIMENHSGDNFISNKNNHIKNYENQNTSLEIINNNPAQCKVCLKILKDPGYLREHMRLHTGDKPFKCDLCNMTFRFKSNLRMHQKKDMPCYIP
ncbi:zinc finger protein 423-like [Aphis gossypii]|uniref:zinc finger protein 423-like n=1 Tax=Aphis gossypii TaxID=80765 RepID=UPI00215981F0|nr:zinc finger protein 423-like [Aphis gossypii]XP_027839143.2 zinc finger protein 423-like [Aphis gossypii]XP_027839153.2 zinc finger protein 423-like [Aphis gossypii]XP_050058173.1 zinc finger protein 423-like [Aphis gossypii]